MKFGLGNVSCVGYVGVVDDSIGVIQSCQCGEEVGCTDMKTECCGVSE